jgi:hypothetical protein
LKEIWKKAFMVQPEVPSLDLLGETEKLRKILG